MSSRGECPDISQRIKLLDRVPVAAGGFSCVYAGTCKLHGRTDRVKVAIKVIRAEGLTGDREYVATLQRRIAREGNLWYRFHHENIIELYGLARDTALSNIVPGLVSPWCKNGTVLQFVRSVPKTRRIPLIRGVASGLAYIHAMGAVHGDLKSANVLMSDDFKPLLTDFGSTKILGVHGYTTDLKTSMMYLSPELMNLPGGKWVDEKGRKRSGTPTTKESDVWAFGLVCAEIVGGREVFHRRDPLRLPHFVIEQGGRPQKADFPNRSKDAETVWPLLQLCWNAAPHRRPTMEGVVGSLS